jgi:hypothetical protein
MLWPCPPANRTPPADRWRVVDEEPYGDELHQWARLLWQAEPHSEQPLRICQLCVDTIDVTGAGISMVTSTRNRGVVCATDDVAEQIESLQLSLGEGPCVDAASHRWPVMVSDVVEPDDVLVNRWPTFVPKAADVGVRAVFALPLRIGAISVGVMDLYRDRPGVLTDKQLSFALMAADAAAVSLLYLDRGEPAVGVGMAGFREAEIHQATGMVSAQLGLPIEEAFLMLRARAYSLDRGLAEVAADVVAHGLRFSAEEAG